MKELDIKKILGENPKTAFEAIDMLIIAQQKIIDAVFIMQSAIEYPDCKDITDKKMIEFVNQFTKE